VWKRHPINQPSNLALSVRNILCNCANYPLASNIPCNSRYFYISSVIVIRKTVAVKTIGMMLSRFGSASSGKCRSNCPRCCPYCSAASSATRCWSACASISRAGSMKSRSRSSCSNFRGSTNLSQTTHLVLLLDLAGLSSRFLLRLVAVGLAGLQSRHSKFEVLQLRTYVENFLGH